MARKTTYGKGFKVHRDTTVLDHIRKNWHAEAQDFIDKTAFDAQGIAANEARVDTGAMRNSFYTVTTRDDGYQDSVERAQDKNPDVLTSPIPSPSPKSDMEARVGPSVEYAIYHELGTRFMEAHPMLAVAAERIWRPWQQGWKNLLRRLR